MASVSSLKQQRMALLLALLCSLSLVGVRAQQTWHLSAHFSPNENLSSTYVNGISQAQHTVDISCYGITDRRISGALVSARSRGVLVRVYVDNGQSRCMGSQVTYLRSNGVEVRIKTSSVLCHNKYVILDGNTVITGSANLSVAANSQDNNSLVISGVDSVTRAYQTDFNRQWSRN